MCFPIPALRRWKLVWQLLWMRQTLCSPSGPVPVEAGLVTMDYSVGISLQTGFHRHGAGWGAFDFGRLLVVKPASTGAGPEWGATLVAAMPLYALRASAVDVIPALGGTAESRGSQKKNVGSDAAQPQT